MDNRQEEEKSEREAAAAQARIWATCHFFNQLRGRVKSSLTVSQSGIQLMTGTVPRCTPSQVRRER